MTTAAAATPWRGVDYWALTREPNLEDVDVRSGALMPESPAVDSMPVRSGR